MWVTTTHRMDQRAADELPTLFRSRSISENGEGMSERSTGGIVMKIFVRLTERKGQAMTEYALILAAIAVATFVTYRTMGTTIVSLLTTVIGDL
jgi:Flp pilus assembly pilin Flp